MKIPSYDAEHEYRGLESELERLRSQVLLSWQREQRLLTWLGLQDGMSVLECGSGPGFVTEQLLQWLPHSKITALDADPQMLARAYAYLSRKADRRLQVEEASIMETGLPDNQFDFAIARYLFQHLSNPQAAAAEILRVLKPGGKVAIIDVDAMLWGIVTPAYPQLQYIYAKTGQAKRDGNKLIGRHLWRILNNVGYRNSQLDAFVYHSDELGLEPFLPQLDPDRLSRVLDYEQISLEEFAIIHAYYQQFLAAPDAYVLMVGLLASGEKAST